MIQCSFVTQLFILSLAVEERQEVRRLEWNRGLRRQEETWKILLNIPAAVSEIVQGVGYAPKT